jgi:hypothetical protein
MSDLQDLIHTNAHNAYEIGVKTERERIIKLLEEAAFTEVNIGTPKKPNVIKVKCDAVRLPLLIQLIEAGQK